MSERLYQLVEPASISGSLRACKRREHKISDLAGVFWVPGPTICGELDREGAR
jgi:hypothetical protein